MLPERIVLESAGSFSIAVLSFLLLVLQLLFFLKRRESAWYVWGAGISFSSLIYSVAIFMEYNAPAGPLNRLAGRMEFTAIICWIHVVYGFTFSYLGIRGNQYHVIACIWHGLILLFLWFTPYIVSEDFVARNFIGLTSPFVEPALGPLGRLFVIYAVAASAGAFIIWIRHKEAQPKHRSAYLTAGAIWVGLGIHDGLAALGFSTFHYLMEYGFFAFVIACVWGAFSSYLETAAEEKYRVIIEFAKDCIVVIQDGRIVFRNSACCELAGLPLANSAARDLLDLTAPEDRRRVFNHFRRLVKGDHRPHTVTACICRSDGVHRFVELASSIIQYRNRPAVLSIMRDVTERKQSQETLRESEEKYRSMMEAMHDSVYISSPDLHIVYMNPAMIGKNGRDATGELCYEALFNRDDPCPWCLHETVQRGEISETEMVHPKENHVYHVTCSPIVHKDGTVSAMMIYRDITVTKRLQEQLLRSDRLSATGQLAATIAHEINSPLQGITSLIHLIEKGHEADRGLLEKLSLVKKGVASIRDTVGKLLDLNRPGKEARQPTHVNILIEDTAALLKGHLEKNRVRMVLDLSSAVPEIVASPQQLGQVFMNLISNAVEAMTDRGRAKAGGKPVEITDAQVTITSRRAGNDVIVEVADTGPGISEDDLGHIFDPFFTRKKEMGMGVGLSLCHSIIEDHRGVISASNGSGGGAVFTVSLPIA